MDLRGFTAQNAGCAYEPHELVSSAPLEKVVIAIDGTSDFSFLEQTLREAWNKMRPDSPNRSGDFSIRVV